MTRTALLLVILAACGASPFWSYMNSASLAQPAPPTVTPDPVPPAAPAVSSPRAGTDPRQPQCLSADGSVACGFHCVSAFSHVRCARTPDGFCAAAQYGTGIACWDPPRPPAVIVEP